MAANPKKSEIIDGYTIKYHANGVTRWSKGSARTTSLRAIGSGTASTARSSDPGTSKQASPWGEWITYDKDSQPYKITQKKAGKKN